MPYRGLRRGEEQGARKGAAPYVILNAKDDSEGVSATLASDPTRAGSS